MHWRCVPTSRWERIAEHLYDSTRKVGHISGRQGSRVRTGCSTRKVVASQTAQAQHHSIPAADRIYIMRPGRRVATVTPKSHSMSGAMSQMTGATTGVVGG
jgi:hypothetical protein